MFGFHVRTRHSSFDSPISLGSPTRSGNGSSPRTDVGEIDTSAPFQSVKAAVCLFGEAVTSPRANKRLLIKKPKTADERVLEKESAFHLALKEQDDLRARLKGTETTKAQAFRELEKANRTLQDLTSKLQLISESKRAAIEATEAAKQRAKDLEEHKSIRLRIGGDAWKQDVNNEREQYKASAAELISAKQELTTLRQDLDVVLEAKLAAFQEAADAQHITQVNQCRVTRISKEITTLRETLGQVKLAILQAQEERIKTNEERQANFQSHEMVKEEVELRIKSLKEEPDPCENLEENLEETMEAIKLSQEQLNNVRDADMPLTIAAAELADAKNKLQEIAEDENSQQSLVDFLKAELDNVKRDHSKLQNMALKAESTKEALQIKIERYKKQLEAALAGCTQEECKDIHLKLQQLASETVNARQEAEDITNNIALLNQVTETACLAAQEAEESLKIALNDVEAAKAAEKRAGEMIHNSYKSGTAHNTSSNSNNKIKLLVKDFESLSNKAEESRADADLKVATIMAQIETIEASENEMLKKLEASMKEKEAIDAAIKDALKQAEMAEAARQVVEGELMKW